VTNPRREYTRAEELEFTTEVDGYCPLCGKSLFYRKKGRSHKGFELAHIYPLNPTREEDSELNEVELLSNDINHPDNIIALCNECHTRFDKPRTREEYEELAEIKRTVIAKAAQRALNSEYPLEADIDLIIENLQRLDFEDDRLIDLELDAKSCEEKFDDSLPHLIRHKIKRDVADYYRFVRQGFRELELEKPTASELIYSQVRSYYLKQKHLGYSQSVIFRHVVEWLQLTTSAQTSAAAEIVASFFVQNCEVFE
jgi:hypothetical protein